MPVKIVITSPYRLARYGLRMLLDRDKAVDVVGEARDAHEMVRQVRAMQPHIVLMDLMASDVMGPAAIRLIKQFWSAVRVITLGLRGDEELIYTAMKAGAWGYLSKQTEGQVLIETAKAIHAGAFVIPPFLAHLALQEIRQRWREPRPPDRPPFSQPEMTLLHLVAQGTPLDVISARLRLAQQTLNASLRGTFDKLPLSPHLRPAMLNLQRGLP